MHRAHHHVGRVLWCYFGLGGAFRTQGLAWAGCQEITNPHDRLSRASALVTVACRGPKPTGVRGASRLQFPQRIGPLVKSFMGEEVVCKDFGLSHACELKPEGA